MSKMQLGLCTVAVAAMMVVVEGQNARVKPPATPGPAHPETLYVDPAKGNDANPGTEGRPVKTLPAVVALLPDPVRRSVTIRLAPGQYVTAGDRSSLELMRRMRPGVVVQFIGAKDAKGQPLVLAWENEPDRPEVAMIEVTEGHWRFEDVQIGTGAIRQRRGVEVSGPGHLDLKNVTFRTRSERNAGIYACRGGKVSLYGDIRMNEHLHDTGGDETFCGIIADDHGLVQFGQRGQGSLDMGNGSLVASYYGVIELGCKTARVTSWGEQSNNLAIDDSGRIDLHNTDVLLRAKNKGNTPIGLEDDGHILGEGAHVTVEGENRIAIALQKASTFTCNDIELKGRFGQCVWASSGSMFVGRFLTDVGRVSATTGANINIEEIKGKFIGPAEADHCASVSLPDREVPPRPK